MTFVPSVAPDSKVYPVTAKLDQYLAEVLRADTIEPMTGIIPDCLAKAVSEYVGETEHNGVEGFRKGITVRDISAILTDFFTYAVNGGEPIEFDC